MQFVHKIYFLNLEKGKRLIVKGLVEEEKEGVIFGCTIFPFCTFFFSVSALKSS